MPTNWLRNNSIVVLIGILILFLLSLVPIQDSRIFSNIFVDSYSPRKVLIIERNPIRIVYMGEFLDTALSNVVDTELSADENSTQIPSKTVSALVGVIRELRLMNSAPLYPLNERTIIDVDSKLTGDRNRGSAKSIVVQTPDGTSTTTTESKD